MPRPTDRVRLVFPHPDDPNRQRVRWWFIQQPAPSVAFTLQGRIAAAVGDSARLILAEFFADPDGDADFEAEKITTSEALALRTLRNARAGKSLFRADDPVACTDRLWAVLHLAQARSGGTMDALALLGEPERVPRSPDHRWPKPALLHRLLLASALRFDGEGDQPREALPDGPPKPPDPPSGDNSARVAYAEAYRRHTEDVQRAALRDAVTDGSVAAFIAALDQAVCSPDELALLTAWAVLHLWRPF